MIQRPPDGSVYTIPTINELPEQALFTYGTTKNSWIREAFEQSKRDPYKAMWGKITDSVPVPLAESNSKGMRWVENDYAFAFFMEETTANYLTRRQPCKFVKIDTDLARREYAFAVPSGSIWRDHINQAIEKLQDEGVIQTLKDKWFIDECSNAPTNLYNSYLIMTLFLVLYLF